MEEGGQFFVVEKNFSMKFSPIILVPAAFARPQMDANMMNNPLMLQMLLNDGDSNSSMQDMPPFLMMQGGQNGQGGNGFDMSNPFFMQMLMGGDGDSSMGDLLPFMMMQGNGMGQRGFTGTTEGGAMNPFMLMTLLGGDDNNGDGNGDGDGNDNSMNDMLMNMMMMNSMTFF